MQQHRNCASFLFGALVVSFISVTLLYWRSEKCRSSWINYNLYPINSPTDDMLWQSSSFSPTLWLNSYSACQEQCCEMPSPTLLQKLIALPADLGELQSGHVWWLLCSSLMGSISRCCQSNWFSFRVSEDGILQGRTTIFHSCHCWKTAGAVFPYSQPGR